MLRMRPAPVLLPQLHRRCAARGARTLGPLNNVGTAALGLGQAVARCSYCQVLVVLPYLVSTALIIIVMGIFLSSCNSCYVLVLQTTSTLHIEGLAYVRLKLRMYIRGEMERGRKDGGNWHHLWPIGCRANFKNACALQYMYARMCSAPSSFVTSQMLQLPHWHGIICGHASQIAGSGRSMTGCAPGPACTAHSFRRL